MCLLIVWGTLIKNNPIITEQVFVYTPQAGWLMICRGDMCPPKQWWRKLWLDSKRGLGAEPPTSCLCRRGFSGGQRGVACQDSRFFGLSWIAPEMLWEYDINGFGGRGPEWPEWVSGAEGPNGQNEFPGQRTRMARMSFGGKGPEWLEWVSEAISSNIG